MAKRKNQFLNWEELERIKEKIDLRTATLEREKEPPAPAPTTASTICSEKSTLNTALIEIKKLRAEVDKLSAQVQSTPSRTPKAGRRKSIRVRF